MLTGDLRNKIDRVWDAFWAGGIANPLEVIEQITYLLFIRGLDDVQTREENKANRLGRPMERVIFPKGSDERGLAFEEMRWSRFRNAAPARMFTIVSDHVFPFIRAMADAETAHGAHMKGARFTIPTPALLAKVVDLLAARAFLSQHEDHIALHKLRQGKPLTATDLSELEGMLLDAGVARAEDIARAKETSQGFGRFVRSLVGLDRKAVSELFSAFIADGAASAEQIEFIGLVVEHLTAQGVMDPGVLYDSPFTDVAPHGPEQVFDESRVTELFRTIETLNAAAVA